MTSRWTRDVAEQGVDVVVNFAAESHNSLAVSIPAVSSDQRARHAEAAGRRPDPRARPLPPHVDLRGVRRSCPRLPGALHRGVAVPAPHAVQRVQGGRRSRRPRVPRDVRVPITISNCANNYGPYQFPEKVLPLFTTQALASGRSPCTGPPRTGGSGCTSSTTARHRAGCWPTAPSARRTTSAAAWR